MNTIQILNFGSLNIDNVYQVPHFVQPKETLACTVLHRGAGGKGLNQSVALARAGVAVAQAGKIGPEGGFLIDTLQQAGVDTQWILKSGVPTGHAIIQVDPAGQNSILLFPGANRALTPAEISGVLARQRPGCWLLLQNEINGLEQLLREGKQRGLKLALNPAPCTPEVRNLPLDLLDLLVVNEVEGAQLTGEAADQPDAQLQALSRLCPDAEIILTLGEQGARYQAPHALPLAIPAVRVKAVDTTSAGDTYIGYYLASRLRGQTAAQALATAARASAITVSRPGAAASIPTAAEIFGA